MNFDLGTNALRKALSPRAYTMRCTVLELGTPLHVQCTLAAKDEYTLEFWARPLMSQSFSYEVGDEVIVEVRSFCEAYVLGLAKELDGTDIENEFHIRLGKNILRGRKDGTQVEFTSGDNNFRIEHSIAGTTVETTGVLTLSGDMVTIGDGLGFGLNCMTVCPLMGVHTPTQQKVMF